MNKAFEKILERLEEERHPEICGGWETMRIDRAKQIVQGIAEEYNNGWIPCSDRLPNVSRCRVTVKYDMEVGNPVYDTLDAYFERYQGGYIFKDNWMNDITNSVIAWQPLPEPYQPKGE